MNRQYRKITVWEVLDAMIELELKCVDSQDSVISISDLAERLDTSKYQVSCIMNCLLMAGITKKGICYPVADFEDEEVKPYRGFQLSEVIRHRKEGQIPDEHKAFKTEIMKYRAFYQKKSMLYKEKSDLLKVKCKEEKNPEEGNHAGEPESILDRKGHL